MMSLVGSAFAIDNFIGRTDFGFVVNSNLSNGILVNPSFGNNIPFAVEIRNKLDDNLNLKLGAVDWVITTDSMWRKACRENGQKNQFSGFTFFDNADYFSLSWRQSITISWHFNFQNTLSGMRHGCVLYYPYYSWNIAEVQAISRKAIIVNLVNSDLWVLQTVTGDFYSGWIVTFSIYYWNNWYHEASWVRLTSMMTWLQMMSAFPGYNDSNGNIYTWNNISLVSGQAWFISITAMINQDIGASTNLMQIGFSWYDHDLSNNISMSWIDLGVMADIFVNHSYGKTMTGDFWLFVRKWAQWTTIYNSAKNPLQPRIYIDNTQNWRAKIDLIPEGDEYLAVFKWDGNLSVWFTWVYSTSLTAFDFWDAIAHPNIYPGLIYNNQNFLLMWDIEFTDIATYDLIHDIDFNTETEKLSIWNNALFDLGDFDVNSTINAIEQAIIVWNIQKKWFIYLIDQPGSQYYSYYGLNYASFR